MEIQSLKLTLVLITIISSLISGIIGVVISIIYHRMSENRRSKIDTLKQFVGYRNDLKGEKFTKALNEIFIVFQDSGDVLDKLNKFHEIIVSRQTSLANDKFVDLFKAMCKDLSIDPSKYGESLLIKAFNVKE
ncbi:hypothetical protein A3I40_01610 [Candidatus Uhrbacteria bacterium RIFCSPLOWO2_02_FULL_48_12]|uniref:DUF6680 domain-containing protein n=1 Tax=Candidatus Uhrbacteria bacterium RIFCSPLOWO2_02_FULL_48_12 TaxID=1802407 RepID=A0A1F7V9T1_9BACT|nr:MAG: hypothetical protein A3I40_01610 [Candidatus Uhrbacteria bacterium RIFCSPLOWO2_02_FULL_48_12]